MVALFIKIFNLGLCYYWGTIRWTADQVQDAIRVCNLHNLHKPIVEETEYNLVKHQFFDTETVKILKKYDRKAVGCSPWDGGFINRSFQKLQYRKNRTFEWEQSGLLVTSEEYQGKTIDLLQELKQISDGLNLSLEEFALSWSLSCPYISTIVIECSKVQQLKECLKSLASQSLFTKDIRGKIQKLLQKN